MRPLLVVMLIGVSSAALADDRPRLIVTTDIGGDPDDTQSLIRLLVFSNEFEIEALVASASGTPGELKRAVVRPDLIRQVVEAYGAVQPNLARHAPGFPTADQLLGKIVAGNPNRGWKHVGEGHDTPASRRIIEIADRDDPRPVNIAIWGGQTDFAQALWRVKQDRGPEGLKAFVAKVRIHDIADQDGIFEQIWSTFPGLFYVLDKAPDGADKRLAAFRGMYLDGDQSLTSREWIDTHVRTGHGPLGALYPSRTWTAPNPHSALKEGDTPSWFYFLPHGLNDPDHPNWGGWGGRFEASDREGLFRDAHDRIEDEPSERATVARWRPHFQNQFQARMDWCVKPPREANHPPVAVLDGDRSRAVVRRAVKAGETVTLKADGSTDPDDDKLVFRWEIYPEAGIYRGAVALSTSDSSAAEIHVPNDANGKSIHVLLHVSDDGQPPLTSSRRVVLEIGDREKS